MVNKRIQLQLGLIYGIIIAAFLGSALLFSYLNTSAMMSAVEKETELAASILTADIHARDLTTYGLAQVLEERLSRALDDVGVDIDIWAVDSSGTILYARGGEFPREAWAATERGTANFSTTATRWVGGKNPFWLDQSLYMARKMSDSPLYLLALLAGSALTALLLGAMKKADARG